MQTLKIGIRPFQSGLAITVLVLASCVTSPSRPRVQFYSFDEPQRAWPTQAWGLMRLVDRFPVYALNQLPPVPYEVRGFVHASADRSTSTADLELAVVQRARQEGGQAALLTKDVDLPGRTTVRQQDYLVVEFKTNGLAAVLERIDIYMSLHPEETHLTGGDSGAERKAIEALKETILRHSQAGSSSHGAKAIPNLAP